jgi:aspartate/methionine/tyrosine aminotransferase
MKLAWIAASGPHADVHEALSRLAVIADTYLSVSTPVQLAAARLIEAGRGIRRAIQARIGGNLDALVRVLDGHPALGLLMPEGGWSAVIRVPALVPEEALVVQILEETSVRVHPGYFFDFPREAFVVVSLLPPPGTFTDALARIVPRLSRASS